MAVYFACNGNMYGYPVSTVFTLGYFFVGRVAFLLVHCLVRTITEAGSFSFNSHILCTTQVFNIYKARHAHKRLYTVLPKYSKIQVLPGITSCRLVKDNKQAIELNSLLINNMPKDGYE